MDRLFAGMKTSIINVLVETMLTTSIMETDFYLNFLVRFEAMIRGLSYNLFTVNNPTAGVGRPLRNRVGFFIL